jgi:hypothetical protein
MYGGDEPSTPSPPVRSQVQQQSQPQREVYVGDELPPRSNSTRRKKTKEPSPSTALPSILTPKASNNSPSARLTENSRSLSVTGDDIEAAFDAINDYKTSTHESANHKPKESEMSSPDSLFGLSTIKEAIDNDENVYGAGSHKQQSDTEIDEIDFDHCLNKYKPQQNHSKPIEEVKTKKSFAPSVPAVQQPQKAQETKSTRYLKEQKRATPSFFDDIQTPTTSIASPRFENTPSPIAPPSLPVTNQRETISSTIEDLNDSNDEDVDELLGKLEVSIDLSVRYTYIHIHIHTHQFITKPNKTDAFSSPFREPFIAFFNIVYRFACREFARQYSLIACLFIAICMCMCVCLS